MSRYLPFVVLIAVLAAIAAITPGTASANDAAVVTSVKKWTVIITPKAQKLGTFISPNTSSTKALASLKSFTKTARRVKYADNGSIQLENASTLTRKAH